MNSLKVVKLVSPNNLRSVEVGSPGVGGKLVLVGCVSSQHEAQRSCRRGVHAPITDTPHSIYGQLLAQPSCVASFHSEKA